MKTIDCGDRLVRFGQCTDYLHILELLEQSRQSAKRQLLVVDDQDADVHEAL